MREKNPLANVLIWSIATNLFLLFSLAMARLDLRREQRRQDERLIFYIQFDESWINQGYIPRQQRTGEEK